MNNSLKTMRNPNTVADWTNSSPCRLNKKEEDSMSENSPVDLVKRVKSESISPEVEESTEISSSANCYDSLAMSAYFIRKRRRGRCRYTSPYYHPEASSTLGTKSSQQVSHSGSDTKESTSNNGGITSNVSLSLNTKSFRGQFSCPNCPMLFSNRDALAMHMMDSVRSQGCPGQVSANNSSNTGASQFSNSSANLKSVLPSLSSNETGTLLHPTSAAKSPGAGLAMYTCRVCGEHKSSLDSLAMHMLAHAHQDQHTKENDPNKMSRSVTQISPTEKSVRHHTLPLIPPLCFNPMEFSSMQQAFNLAMATMTAAAASAKSTINNESTLEENKFPNLRETTTSSNNASPPINPPKCHSVPLPASNFYIGDDDLNPPGSGLTPTGSEKNEGHCTSFRRENSLVRQKGLYTFDEGDESLHIMETSKKSEYDTENVEDQTIVKKDLDDRISGTSPDIDKEYSEDTEFGAIRRREYYYACRHCRMTFEDRTIFCLHMGLHNVNNPWQCNMCSKVCSGLHEFASHSLHF